MNESKEKFLESLKKFNSRFKDVDWASGNCYYYAVILQARFGGKICYDVIRGHFVLSIEGLGIFDYYGEYTDPDMKLVEWEHFADYDILQKERIIRDCIQNDPE